MKSILVVLLTFAGAIAGAADKSTFIWNHTDTGTRNVAFSPDGNLLLAGGSLYDAHTGELVRVVQKTNKPGVPNMAEFSGDGKWIVIASDRQSGHENLNVYDAATGEVVAKFNSEANSTDCAHFSPKNDFLIASFNGGYAARTLRVWRTSDWKLTREIFDNGHKIMNCAVANNNKWVAISDDIGNVEIFDVNDGSLVRKLHVANDYVFAIAFDPTSTYLAAGGSSDAFGNHPLQLYDIERGYLIDNLRWFEKGAVLSLKFSGDGDRLIAGGEDLTGVKSSIGGVRIYDVTSGNIIKSVGQIRGTFIRSVDIRNDGGFYALSSDWRYGDKTVFGVGSY